MREPLRRRFLDPQMDDLMGKAQNELDLLTQDMHLEVQPYDPEYEEKLRKWHSDATKDGATFSEAEEVLEKMLIYYEVSSLPSLIDARCRGADFGVAIAIGKEFYPGGRRRGGRGAPAPGRGGRRRRGRGARRDGRNDR